jgi:hypothetical protein
VAHVSVGGSHTTAVKSNGDLWAWGNNTNGQLGDGTVIGRRSPRPYAIAIPVTAAAALGAAVGLHFIQKRWRFKKVGIIAMFALIAYIATIAALAFAGILEGSLLFYIVHSGLLLITVILAERLNRVNKLPFAEDN